MSTLSDERLLGEVSEAISQRMREGMLLCDLSWPEQVVALVYGAQGVIDNGGLLYFFDNDWPDNPPYSLFVEAYQTIGLEKIAKCIASVTAAFPFPEPHLHREARAKYLDEHYSEENGMLLECDDFAVAGDVVFARLAVFVREKGLISVTV